MRWIRLYIICVVVLLIAAGLNYFFQKQLIDFFTSLKWEPMISLVSGPWWNFLPTLILAAGVLFAIWQIMETRKSTNAQIAVELFRELRNEDALRIVRFIYGLDPEEKVQNLPAIDKHNIDYLLDRLDLLGALVEKRIIDKPLAIEGFGGPAVLRCWYQLVRYIRNIQDERGYYVENYETLARRSLEYFDENHIRIPLNDIHDIPDLVGKIKAFKKSEDESTRNLYPRSLGEIRNHRKIGKA